MTQSALYRNYSTACNRVKVEARRPNKRAVVMQARSDVTQGYSNNGGHKSPPSGYILKVEPVGFLKEMSMQYYGEK